MRIGIDGRELIHKRTGVGCYLAELCKQWLLSPRAERHEFVVYTPQTGADLADLGQPFTNESNSRFRHRGVPGSSSSWWEQVNLPMATTQDDLDLFFGPAYSAPLGLKIPSVITMHDVSFIAHPEWFKWGEGLRRRWLAQQSLARAHAVISVSAFTRTEILRFFNVPAERVRVVLSGFTPRSCTSTMAESDPLVLFVGSIFNRRHLPTLVRAFSQVHRAFPDAQLALVGDDRTYPQQDLPGLIRQTGIQRQVSLKSYVSETELDQLYGRARVFVFLSEYEGFGFTPLEAMSAGVPVVVADTPVARELYGDAVLFVPVADTKATAAAITMLLTDEEVRDRQQRRAAARLTKFTWKRAANDTLDSLESAITVGS